MTITLDTRRSTAAPVAAAAPVPSISPEAALEYELEALAEAALTAQQKAADAEAASKSATAAFKEKLAEAKRLNADTKVVGIVRTTIYPTKRFDETKARAILTKKLAKECEKTVLDSAKVKANVSPADYEKMQAVSGFTMKLSIDKEQVS